MAFDALEAIRDLFRVVIAFYGTGLICYAVYSWWNNRHVLTS